MIEPVIATALILSILALIAYYLQPRKPHHQRHYYHQIRRARVMADPQRRGREGGLFVGAERRNERQVYERGNEDGGREAGEWASGVRKLNTAGRGVVESRLVQEEGVDAEDEKEAGAAAESVVEDASSDKLKVHTDAISQASIVPVIRITIPDSDNLSSILSSHDAEQGVASEGPYSNTLDQQRRQRVRFDEALRMHSYGGSQYVGTVVDKAERKDRVVRKKEEKVWGGCR